MKRRLNEHVFSRKNIIEKIENNSITLIDHIIYILIFNINEGELRHWVKEILSKVWIFQRLRTKLPKVKRILVDDLYKIIEEFKERIDEALIEKGDGYSLKVNINSQNEITCLYSEILAFIKFLCELTTEKKENVNKGEVIKYYFERGNTILKW